MLLRDLVQGCFTPGMFTMAMLVLALQYFTDHPPSSGTADRLRTYITSGKGLVLATFAMNPAVSAGVDISPYNLHSLAFQTSCTGSMSVTAAGSSHPILAGVSAFGALPGFDAYCNPLTVTDPTVTILATWGSSGRPLVSAKTFSLSGGLNVRRVDLNFFPPSSNTNFVSGNYRFWDASTGGGKLMARSLLWVAGSI